MKGNEDQENKTGLRILSPMKIKPMIAGILLITSGMIFLDASTRYLLIDDKEIENLREQNNESDEILQNVTNSQIKQSYILYGIVGLTVSAFVLIGGVLSIFRKKWKISLAFSILGIISTLLLFLIMFPLILIIIASIVLYLSKKDFNNEKTT